MGVYLVNLTTTRSLYGGEGEENVSLPASGRQLKGKHLKSRKKGGRERQEKKGSEQWKLLRKGAETRLMIKRTTCSHRAIKRSSSALEVKASPTFYASDLKR